MKGNQTYHVHSHAGHGLELSSKSAARNPMPGVFKRGGGAVSEGAWTNNPALVLNSDLMIY